ncbi:hypothetical protein WN944_028508 [Citrus x changshan-huyou]|uniref:Rhodanese domain-containing protein n=1 Tax=Citrus x changshan-huyou TaxID=2935761 RepID=A0AAP0LJZ3_9ROSI
MSCRNIFALTKLRKNSFIPIRTIIDVGKRPAGDVASVGVDTAKDLLSSGHRFLDVRTTEEFNESHVHGALNVPYLFITQEGDLEFIILPNFQNPEATNTVLDASYIVSPGNVSRKQFVFSDFLAIFPGRVKNPEFLTQVASVCSKEDHIIVEYFASTKLRKNSLRPILSIMDAIKKPEDVASVDVHAAKDLLGSGHRYLDVRTTAEFKKGHVDKALNAPYMSIMQGERVKKNPEFLTQVASLCKKEDPSIVVCNSGGRALRACVDLRNAVRLFSILLDGGYSAWVDEGVAGDKPLEELKISCKFR